METYTRDIKANGKTLYTDSSATTRLAQRPSKSKGAAYEDFGSDFRKRSPSRMSQDSRSMPTVKKASSSKYNVVTLSDDLSDDEIDFLSSSSSRGSKSPVKPWKHHKQQDARPTIDVPVPIAIDHHQKDPGYRALNFRKMKIPKKSSAASAVAAPQGSQNDRVDRAPDPSTPPGPALSSKGSALCSSRESDPEPPKKKSGDHPLRERSPNHERTRPRKPYLPDWDNSDGEGKDPEKTPRASPRPRPVTKGKMAKSQTIAEMQSSTSQDRSEVKDSEKIRHVTQSKSMLDFLDDSLLDADEDLSSPKSKVSKGKARAQTPDKVKPQETGKAKMKEVRKVKAQTKAGDYDPIGELLKERAPAPRPVQRARRKQLSDFPMPSPLSSPSAGRSSSPPRPSQTRGRRVVLSDEEEESDASAPSLQPFPMETQMLESLHQIPSAKRSAAGSDVEREHGAYRKKLRRDSHQRPAFSIDSDSDSDLDDIFLDPSVDPATLCPWCDEPLPTNPTPHLASLLSAARRRSYPDERPTNPLGLRASPTVFVGVCQRHRFERVWIPRASKRGWPTSIDWNGLRGRVEKLKEKLKSIVDDVDQDFAPHTKGKGKQREESGSRRTNEFWQELVKNVKEQGSRQTTGVRGQFLHFNKTQPGYYGELGYMIVHQTLCNLFPPTTFDAAAALPLTPADFISHVLVPEAALNLIMEDLNLSRGDALRTLRESVEYGVAMFPADEGEGGKGDSDVLGVGEKIVMERARARRKELEEEERREEEEERIARERARQSDTEPDMDLDSDCAPSSSYSSKPKPRPVKRKPSAPEEPKAAPPPRRGRSRSKTPASGCNVIELSSDGGDTSDAPRTGVSKRRRKGRDEPPSEKSDAPTDTGATPRPKPKPRPRPIGRAALSSASQPDMRDAPLTRVDDTRSDPVEAPWDRKQSMKVYREGMDSTVESTPRPKPKPKPIARVLPRSSPPDPGTSKVGADPSRKTPLDIARERRQERNTSHAKAKPSDGWSFNLRHRTPDDPHSTDDEGPSPRDGPTNPRADPPRRTRSVSAKDQFSWLLSDGSSSRSRTPSFTNFD